MLTLNPANVSPANVSPANVSPANVSPGNVSPANVIFVSYDKTFDRLCLVHVMLVTETE